MLEAGMKVMIVGCSTPSGSKYIGRVVQLHQILERGDVFDPEAVKREEGSIVIWDANRTAGLVYHPALGNIDDDDFVPEYAVFDIRYLMPIPPLEDPGIDECTFTPIVQAEPA